MNKQGLTKNSQTDVSPLLINALTGRNRSRPPIWLMRQAGRYMPEYRSMRSRHSFLDMCHHPELIVEVTQLPIRAFGMDAAILFSDILIIFETLGIPIRFEDGIGPIIDRPIRTEEDVESLKALDPKEVLGFVAEGIRLLKKELSVPLIGFCGAPFTVASYALEGKSSRDLKITKEWLFRNSNTFHRLLDKIFKRTVAYLKMQIEAGVDAIQIFDSWAHVLGYEQFQEVSQFYLKKLIDELRPLDIPIIVFCRGTAGFISQLVQLNPQAISVDWSCCLADVRKQVPSHIALQGNLDPHVLYAPTHIIKKEVRKLLDSMQNDPAYIFNLGHGILPDISPDAVKTLVECVQK